MRLAGRHLRAEIVVAIAAAVLVTAAAALAASSGPAGAQYFRRPISSIDPNIMLIDEKAVLGAKINPETVLIDQDGREFKWSETIGKPVVLVLSYYTCDGTCSVINTNLANLLRDVKAVTPGEDYRIVTLSFDRHDKLASTGAFKRHLALTGPIAAHWTFATFKNEADLKSETERVGFKFFWSPEDRVFLHPGAFLFFSPDSRLVRVLYQDEIAGRDVELAVFDAKQGQFRPREVINFMISLCYSYSYHDGRYVVNIPVFVGFGALAFGIATLFGSMFIYKRNERSGEKKNVEAV